MPRFTLPVKNLLCRTRVLHWIAMMPRDFCLVRKETLENQTTLYFSNVSGYYYDEGLCNLCRRFYASEDLSRFRELVKVEVLLAECPFPIEEYKFVVEGVFLPIVVSFGVIGNLMSWIKFCKQRSQKVFHFLLVALAAFDTVNTKNTKPTLI